MAVYSRKATQRIKYAVPPSWSLFYPCSSRICFILDPAKVSLLFMHLPPFLCMKYEHRMCVLLLHCIWRRALLNGARVCVVGAVPEKRQHRKVTAKKFSSMNRTNGKSSNSLVVPKSFSFIYGEKNRTDMDCVLVIGAERCSVSALRQYMCESSFIRFNRIKNFSTRELSCVLCAVLVISDEIHIMRSNFGEACATTETFM